MLRLEHLPADVLPLDALLRRALAGRPDGLAPLRVPARAEDVPPPAAPSGAPAVAGGNEARAAVAESIERGVAALEPHVAAVDAARSLARADASCVVARVVPGLAGGRLRSLWRALHAAALARALAARFDAPVVPLLWVDGDEPPAERDVHWLGEYFDLVRLRLANLAQDGRAASEVRLDAETHRLGAFREQLAQLAPTDRAPSLEPFLPRHGETFARSAARVWSEVLSPLGVCVVETERLREPLARSLARLAALAARAPSLEPAFALRVGDGPVRALRWRESGFRYDDEPGSRTAAELAAEMVQEPARFAPGPAARAAALAAVLPVAAQVGDAAELAARVAARELESAAAAPPLVPALRATWVDEGSRRALGRLGLDVEAVLRSRGELGGERDTSAVARELRAVAERAAAELLARREELALVDRGLAQQLRRAAADVQRTVGRLCERAERVEANRLGKSRRHLRRLAATLAPRGEPQEDVLSVVQTAVLHGTGWLAPLVDEIDPFPVEHAVVHLPAAG